MLTCENSTSAAGDATVTCLVSATMVQAISDDIDKRDGLIARSQAGKHLSAILMSQIENLLGHERGKPGKISDTRTFDFHQSRIEEIQWLVAEVWEVNQDLAKQVDEIAGNITDMSNSAYDALKASGGRK